MNNKLKTLLLHLPLNLDNIYDYDNVLQPYGLACISSFLKLCGCEVVLYDANALHVKRREIIKYVRELHPDIIGLTVYTSQLPQTISFAREIKKIYPDALIVVGGPHPSSGEHKNILEQNREIDIVVIGEGEYAMLELIKTIQNAGSFEQLEGIVYRADGEVKVNPPREYIQDLDSLPFADWSSLPMKNYWGVPTQKKNFVNLLTSRGCQFSCTFCGSKVALGKKVRKRSPANILDEIKLLYDKFNVRDIYFNDPVLNADNQWAYEIAGGILKLNKRDLVWGCNLRADRTDKELLKLMKRSRLTNVFMGVESGDDNMLKSMKKGINVNMIRDALAMLDEAGIKVYCGFIMGMPGETEESIKKTLAFARELRKYSTAFSLATPFPGTEFYEKAKEEGLYVEDWSKFDYHGIPYVPKGLTRAQLYYYYSHTVMGYYLNPGFLLNQLLQIRSWMQFKKTLRLGFRIIFRRVAKLKKIVYA